MGRRRIDDVQGHEFAQFQRDMSFFGRSRWVYTHVPRRRLPQALDINPWQEDLGYAGDEPNVMRSVLEKHRWQRPGQP